MKNEIVEQDLLARHDEAELIELGEADTYGGTAWVCATVTLATAAICPTTKCTKEC
ncbi:class II lanthipeptide, LchA2/BrtA2 family [Actinoplanes sp. M2I2]|uniref:class II lanthipeptide, LchA2/BrtA2 family n=1 Tax=Actinoplanes sp. M2I2 TaxID=1734444 RepID=UPI0020210150|nr:class II lanthipeptide, LchA2/BrtA2 family [Actinoplanes sp. M2I2]